jgi:hypothetical protein
MHCMRRLILARTFDSGVWENSKALGNPIVCESVPESECALCPWPPPFSQTDASCQASRPQGSLSKTRSSTESEDDKVRVFLLFYHSKGRGSLRAIR